MFNQDALKKITILYVEDDTEIRESMSNIFNKLFKKIYMAEDGLVGLKLFKQLKDDKQNIDIIISDINMPNMNGLDMLKEIRILDKRIPIVLTTAHAEKEYFLEAIQLGVMHYAIKPLIIKNLLLQIQDIGLQKYQDIVINTKQKENERYIDILDKVAIVSRTDIHGNIIFANDIFSEVSGYSNEELIGSNQRIVRHPDMSKEIFDNLWNMLRAKKIWRGKIKNKAKDGTPYFVNANIFPVFDETGENVIEYMAVRFLITEEEGEKRIFRQKVMLNIQEGKKKENELNSKIKWLENQLKFSDRESIALIHTSLDNEKQKSARARAQVAHYERELKYEKDRYNTSFQISKKKIADLITENKANKDSSYKYREKSLKLDIKLKTQKEETQRLNEIVESQAKIIKDLKDVIDHRESQLKSK